MEDAYNKEKRRLLLIEETRLNKKIIEEETRLNKKRIEEEEKQLWQTRFTSLLKYGKATRKKELGSYVGAAIDPRCWKCKRTIEQGEITWSWYYRVTRAGYTISEQHAMFLCLECLKKEDITESQS